MRRTTSGVAMVLAVGVWLGCASPESGAGAPGEDARLAAAPSARTFRFTYRVNLPAPAAGTRQLAVWVPLPQDDPGVQKVADLALSAPAGYRVTTEGAYGNRMLHLAVADPTGPLALSWSATITRHEDHGQGRLPVSQRFLLADRLVPTDGKARELAHTLGVLDAKVAMDLRAFRIYHDVLSSMDYDKTGPGWGQGSFEHAVTACKGNCTDFHARFTGVGRAAGIPVRFTMGIPIQAARQGSYESYHCWAHWHNGKSWKPVDISEASKVLASDKKKAAWYYGHLPHDRVAVSVGRDLVLAPAQQGAPLNFFVFPYAEADGKPMALGKGCWRFEWEDR